MKGIEYLIDATAKLALRDLPPFEVAFAGDGPDLADFVERATRLGIRDRFHYLGYVADTTGLLRNADIVVVPSNWGDAFPYSVLEAMAARKAIVATRVGGIPEQLGEPPTGVLVPPGDAEALADALAELILSPTLREELAVVARRRAEERFREHTYLERLLTELRSELGLGRSAAPESGKARHV